MTLSVLLRLTPVELHTGFLNFTEFYKILYPGKLNKKYLQAFSRSLERTESVTEKGKKEPDLFVAT